MKYFTSSLLPTKAPTNRNKKNTHPASESDAIPVNNAPILQPRATRAPYPINNPPNIAAIACLQLLIFLILNCEANNTANNAPKIIPKFLTDTPFWKKPALIASWLKLAHVAIFTNGLRIQAPHKGKTPETPQPFPVAAKVTILNNANNTAPVM
jgi:hypothetical protein